MPLSEPAQKQGLFFWGVVLGSMLLALAVRLLYLVDLQHTPFFAAPQMDALYHHQWAGRLAAGDWIGSDVFFRAPLYPYLLGLLYKLGLDGFAVRVVQFIIGSVTVGITTAIVLRQSGRVAGIAIGLMLALYGPLIYFEGELLLVVLEALLNLLMVWSLHRAVSGSSTRSWFVAGVLLSLAALTRPIVLAVPLAVAVVLLLKRKREALKPLCLYALGFMLLVGPVLVRNHAVGKDIVPIASQGGLNFYLGNHEGADGRAALAENFRATWTGGLEDAQRQAEIAEGRSLKPSEVSRYWYGQAFSWITANPYNAGKLMFRKFRYFLDPYEIPNNQDYYFFSKLTRVFNQVPLFNFFWLGPLALLGLLWNRGPQSLPASYRLVPVLLALVIVAFFVCGRFRVSLVPLFAIWAGAGIAGLVQAVQNRHWKPLSFMILFLAVFVSRGFMDVFEFRKNYTPAESHLRLGIHYASQKQDSLAEVHYKQAIQVAPGFAEAKNNLGTLYAAQGKTADAERLFMETLRLAPNHPKAISNLAGLTFAKGEKDRALTYAQQIRAMDTQDPNALYNAAVVFGNLGEIEAAQELFARLGHLQPWNAGARLGEARALFLLGNRERAREVLLSMEPSRRTPEMEDFLKQLEAP